MSNRSEESAKKSGKKTMKSPSLGKKILGGVGLGVLCLLGLALGTIGGYVSRSKLLKAGLASMIKHDPPQKVFGRDNLNILILGCDEDVTTGGAKVTKQQARSDMMMLAHCDFKEKTISAISLPRDTYYKMPGDKNGHKINAFHAYGGNPLAKKAVENLLGIKIDRVVALDFVAFQDLVNLVGGVDLTVDKPLDYDDNAGHLHIHLKPGPQHMNGYNAMCFVRYRHGDSDLYRQLRQHQFLMALKDKVMHRPQSMEEVAEMGQKVLGNEFNDDETISLAMFGRSIAKDSLRMGQTPVVMKKHSGFLYLNKKATNNLLVEMGLKAPGSIIPISDEPKKGHRTARNDDR